MCEILFCGEFTKLGSFRLPKFPAGVIILKYSGKESMFRVSDLSYLRKFNEKELLGLLVENIPERIKGIRIESLSEVIFHEGIKDATAIIERLS